MTTRHRHITLSLGLTLLAAGAAGAAPRAFTIDPASSTLTVHVRKGGLFSFVAHDHDVLTTAVTGQVTADAAEWTRSSVSLVFPTAGLKVDASKEPEDDGAKVQKTMEDAVLEIATYKSIAFASTAVTLVSSDKPGIHLELAGILELHGVKRRISLPVDVTLDGATLTAKGKLKIRQTDFAIKPISIAGGAIKVKDELELSFTMVARETPAPAPVPVPSPPAFPPSHY